MKKHLIQPLSDLLANSNKSFIYRILFCLLFISPVIFLIFLNYNEISNESLNNIFFQKKSLSYLASAIVQEKLNSIIKLGILISSGQEFINEIENRKWNTAINRLTDIPKNLHYIDRIVLYDKAGFIKADLPSAVPTVLGQSRTDKEWHKNLLNDWNPLVSDIYKRNAEPKINVICIVIPIKSISSITSPVHSPINNTDDIIGILQLQLNLDIFSEWINESLDEKDGFIYIVDQHGHIIYHPKLDYKNKIIDFSSVPIIQKLIRGTSGVELNYNPVEKEMRVSAYTFIKQFGWGIVVTQPARFAFEARNKSLRQMIIIYMIIIILCISLALFVLYIILLNKKIRDLATHDFLTGLPNRILMEDRILTALIMAKRNKKMIAVISIDIDHFKDINDKYGHKAGDDVLKEISNRIKKTIRDSDSVSRYGGDEFVMLITNLDTKKELEQLLNRIMTAVRKPLKFDTDIFTSGISLGVALSDTGQHSPDELIQRSDKALYKAKNTGRNRFVYSD